MLPFLKSRKQTGLIISHRKPTGEVQESHSEDDEIAPLRAAAEDLIRAVHDKDVAAVAEALESAFEICDSMPHVEGEHIESNEE